MNNEQLLQALRQITKRNGRTLSRANGSRADLWTTADMYIGTDAYTGTLADVLAWEQGYTSPTAQTHP